MSAIAMFSFENTSVRTLGTPELPLFVAIDVATALGYKNPKVAPAQHVDPEDLIKQEITDKLGRAQAVNCVNESGLYALIFGSKLESAKRFKRWVTSEVLPAIRKNGHYEVATASNTLSSEEQYEIRKAVKSRAKNSSIHYQGSSSKTPVAKPDGTKMFCSAFLNDARMCCFFANAIVKY
jgi:prophage antirepressor-like protein